MASLQSLLAYIPPDRRAALAAGTELPTRTDGAALWADLSGFTPLTETLVSHLGERHGADELAVYLNQIYTALIAPVEACGGSVIDFSGDAITCWFDADDGTQAVAAACAMQVAIRPFESLQLPTGERIALGVKVAIACGAVRRFRVGDANVQYLDTMIGPVMDHLAAAGGLARTGEILLDESVATHLPVSEWRTDPDVGRRVVVLNCPEHPPVAFPALPAHHPLGEEQVRAWLLPQVFECIQGGQGEFLTELCPAVALFICFEGFNYDDDEVCDGLDALICHTQRILTEYEGTLLQLTLDDKGSYIYVAFGAPTAHEDDTLRATAAALKLRRLPESVPGIQSIRMGMSQGVMRTGSYGCETRRTYGVLGEDVNLAARLMQKAAPGQILVSESVWQGNSDFHWQTLPAMQVKGRQTPVQPAALLGWREQNALDLPPVTPALPMIGRQAELATLHEKFALALQGQGQIVSIVGEAGLGKSRLLAEALQQAGAFTRHGGECQSYGMHSTYTVWLPIWLSFFGQSAAAATAEQIRGIETALAQINPDFPQRLPLLDTILNLSIPDNGLTDGMDAKTRKTLREALLVDCARNRAAESPLIFILEDLHWADPLSLALLEALARATQSLPVLILLTYRPHADGLAPTLTALPHHTSILVTELSAAETEELIASRLHNFGLHGPVSPVLVQQLSARAQGNPFYIEELLNYQFDHGRDPRDPAIWAQGDLPESLHSLILTRIDQLGEHQQITIKAASVIGRLFRAAWLYEYCPFLNAAQAAEDLKALNRLDFVVQDAPEPQLSYLFKHVITQEVAYENLAYATRASLHEHFARYLEQTAADDVYAYLDLLVYHYERSDNLPKKRLYLRKAGEAAQKAYANDAAIAYLGKALALAPADDHAERFEILFARQDVYSILMNRPAENADLLTLAALADALNDNARRAKVALRRSNYAYFMGDYQIAAEAAEQTVGLAHLAEAYDVEALAYVRWSDIFKRQGYRKEAHLCSKKALALSEKIQNDNLVALSLIALGTAAMEVGNLDDANVFFDRALSFYRMGGYKRNEPVVLYNIATLNSYFDLRKAQDYYEQALVSWHAMGDRRFECIGLSQFAYTIFECRADYGKARQYCHQALRLSLDVTDPAGEISTLYSLAAIELVHNHYLLAQLQLEQALNICIKINYLLYHGACLARLGTVFCQQGNFEQALAYCNEGILILREAEDVHELCGGLIALGQLHYHLQNHAAAEEIYTEALVIAKNAKNRLEHTHALVMYGHLLLERNDLPQAAESYNQGLALALEVGLHHYAKQAQTGLAWIALKQGNHPEALTLLEEVLPYLATTHPLGTIDETPWMYLTCYHILQATADLRAAITLQAGYTLLQEIAVSIEDPALRDSFLQNVRFNREIIEAWHENPESKLVK